MSNVEPRRVLISIFHDVRGGRAFVREFAATSRNWEGGCMLHVRSPVEGFRNFVKSGRWDGMVVQIISMEDRKALEQVDCPVILLDPRHGIHPHLDRVEFDHEAVGRLAARHLLDTGRRHFAMLGFDQAKISERREAAFVATVRKAGLRCPVLRVPVDLNHPRTRVGDDSLPEIRRFVRELPSPAAVFCGNDELARVLLESAYEEGIGVPHDLAIIGADDDDLLCLTCTPTISSVRVPYHVAGRKAARLLEKRLRRPGRTQERILVPPTEVVIRDSSRVVPGEDRAVEEAMRRMHQGFSGQLRMAELAQAAGLSISSLERRFKAALGVTPSQELMRLRLHEARRLLAETSLPIGKVALASGFQSPTRFCIAFREGTGTSPSGYRQRHQQGRNAR
ncbi:MAG: substrate-binding domain-containing protein [Akkermansiaceae bacterium]|jgi:LacI family transcriptional regulator|nr:substrate-binding domain-containing protein [Akkermansiaceae bacterium]